MKQNIANTSATRSFDYPLSFVVNLGQSLLKVLFAQVNILFFH